MKKSKVLVPARIIKQIEAKGKNLPMEKIDSIEKLEDYRKRADGWINIMTNLGVQGRDKRTAARVYPHVLQQAVIESLYQSGDIEARVVDIIPEEMCRQGWKIIVPGDLTDVPEQMQTQWDRFQIGRKIQQCLNWARLYGGSALLLGLDDGLSPDQPVDLNRIRNIEYITALDRFRIFPAQIINYDATSQNFGYPDYYRIYTQLTSIPLIHHSRIIRFEGAEVPWRLRGWWNYWGDSVYGRLYKVIRDFHATHDNVALIIQNFFQLFLKMKNLGQILAMGPDGDRKIMKRLELLNLTMSSVNAAVVQDDEEIDRKTITVAGLSDLVNTMNNRLVAATGIPHTLLLGESPSGLGATGNSEKIDFYDHVKGLQRKVLEPVLLRLLEIFFSAKQGITNGKVPDKFAVEFNPLWQMSDKEAGEIRLNQAKADDLYIANGTLQPEEIAQSRFGSGQYSVETQLDQKLRGQVEEAIAKGKALTEGPPKDQNPPWAMGKAFTQPETYLPSPAPALSELTGQKKKGPLTPSGTATGQETGKKGK